MRRAAEEESEKKVDEEQVVWYVVVVMKDGESKKYKISMVNGTTFTVNINSSDDDYGDCDQVISDAMKKRRSRRTLSSQTEPFWQKNILFQ